MQILFQFTKEGFLIDKKDKTKLSEDEQYQLLYNTGLGGGPKDDADTDSTECNVFYGKNRQLHVPECVFFNLMENKDADYPFAFLATYATQGADNKVQHMP